MVATFTVSELAEFIRTRNESERAAANRLRNWTVTGLIEPYGEKNPGTGRDRLYRQETLIDVLVLQALTENDEMPAVVAAKAVDLIAVRKYFLNPKNWDHVLLIGRDFEKRVRADLFKVENVSAHIIKHSLVKSTIIYVGMMVREIRRRRRGEVPALFLPQSRAGQNEGGDNG